MTTQDDNDMSMKPSVAYNSEAYIGEALFALKKTAVEVENALVENKDEIASRS